MVDSSQPDPEIVLAHANRRTRIRKNRRKGRRE
jgi:hypothetical protein